VIPVSYWLLYANKPGHGLPPTDDEDVAAESAHDVAIRNG
jgi:hypothetical protein